jgi:hypothetical protein
MSIVYAMMWDGEMNIPGSGPIELARKIWLMSIAEHDIYARQKRENIEWYWGPIQKRWEWWEKEQGKRYMEEHRL